jgi:hypothetical protein
MPVTATWYTVPIRLMYAGSNVVDWDTDTLKVSLHTSAYTPAETTHDFFNDVTSEISGTGYTTGGQTLTSTTVTSSSNVVSLDAADASWTSASFTARYAVVRKDTGNSSTSPLIAYVDFGGDETVSSGTFSIVWDSTGVATITT